MLWPIGRRDDGDVNCQLVFVRVDADRAELIRKLQLGSLNFWDLPRDLQCDPECALAVVRRNPLVTHSLIRQMAVRRGAIAFHPIPSDPAPRQKYIIGVWEIS